MSSPPKRQSTLLGCYKRQEKRAEERQRTMASRHYAPVVGSALPEVITLDGDSPAPYRGRVQPMNSRPPPAAVAAPSDDGFDDEAVLAAVREIERACASRPSTSTAQTTVPSAVVVAPAAKRAAAAAEAEEEACVGFDREKGRTWVYPLNEPLREYQERIVARALFANTLVALPTGLGKTLIAAVVLYNFYRWYPEGKVLFVAPTRPLVEQQVAACFRSMGFPADDAARMTGDMRPTDRALLWQRRRLFFLTPQTLQSDLEAGRVPAECVRCVVLDEAHKATGKHSYCESVRMLLQSNDRFRLLALSATPGNDRQAIQQVLTNLLIARVDTRTEESADVAPYLPGRSVQPIVVPLSPEILRLKVLFERAFQPKLDQLFKLGALSSKSVGANSSFGILEQTRNFRQANNNRATTRFNAAAHHLSFLQIFYRGFEYLLKYGMRSLYDYLLEKYNSTAPQDKRLWTTFSRDESLAEVWEALRRRYGRVAAPVEPDEPVDEEASKRARRDACLDSHPKMRVLGDTLHDHFASAARLGEETRAMVFTTYRSSVLEIVDFLRLVDRVRPSAFVGQSSGAAHKAPRTADGAACRTQRQQAATIADFLEGTSNVLVSTCVGEEGLDVGEVDLIVFYDAVGSAVRNVQRMGRTGRRRVGRVVALLTEDYEQNKFNQAQYQKKHVLSTVFADLSKFQFYKHNRRLVPADIEPEQSLEMLEIPVYEDLTLKHQKVEKERPRRQSAGEAAGDTTQRTIVGFLSPDANEPSAAVAPKRRARPSAAAAEPQAAGRKKPVRKAPAKRKKNQPAVEEAQVATAAEAAVPPTATVSQKLSVADFVELGDEALVRRLRVAMLTIEDQLLRLEEPAVDEVEGDSCLSAADDDEELTSASQEAHRRMAEPVVDCGPQAQVVDECLPSTSKQPEQKKRVSAHKLMDFAMDLDFGDDDAPAAPTPPQPPPQKKRRESAFNLMNFDMGFDVDGEASDKPEEPVLTRQTLPPPRAAAPRAATPLAPTQRTPGQLVREQMTFDFGLDFDVEPGQPDAPITSTQIPLVQLAETPTRPPLPRARRTPVAMEIDLGFDPMAPPSPSPPLIDRPRRAGGLSPAPTVDREGDESDDSDFVPSTPRDRRKVAPLQHLRVNQSAGSKPVPVGSKPVWSAAASRQQPLLEATQRPPGRASGLKAPGGVDLRSPEAKPTVDVKLSEEKSFGTPSPVIPSVLQRKRGGARRGQPICSGSLTLNGEWEFEEDHTDCRRLYLLEDGERFNHRGKPVQAVLSASFNKQPETIEFECLNGSKKLTVLCSLTNFAPADDTPLSDCHSIKDIINGIEKTLAQTRVQGDVTPGSSDTSATTTPLNTRHKPGKPRRPNFDGLGDLPQSPPRKQSKLSDDDGDYGLLKYSLGTFPVDITRLREPPDIYQDRAVVESHVQQLKEALLVNPLFPLQDQMWAAIAECTKDEFDKSNQDISRFELTLIGGLHRKRCYQLIAQEHPAEARRVMVTVYSSELPSDKAARIANLHNVGNPGSMKTTFLQRVNAFRRKLLEVQGLPLSDLAVDVEPDVETAESKQLQAEWRKNCHNTFNRGFSISNIEPTLQAAKVSGAVYSAIQQFSESCEAYARDHLTTKRCRKDPSKKPELLGQHKIGMPLQGLDASQQLALLARCQKIIDGDLSDREKELLADKKANLIAMACCKLQSSAKTLKQRKKVIKAFSKHLQQPTVNYPELREKYPKHTTVEMLDLVARDAWKEGTPYPDSWVAHFEQARLWAESGGTTAVVNDGTTAVFRNNHGAVAIVQTGETSEFSRSRLISAIDGGRSFKGFGLIVIDLSQDGGPFAATMEKLIKQNGLAAYNVAVFGQAGQLAEVEPFLTKNFTATQTAFINTAQKSAAKGILLMDTLVPFKLAHFSNTGQLTTSNGHWQTAHASHSNVFTVSRELDEQLFDALIVGLTDTDAWILDAATDGLLGCVAFKHNRNVYKLCGDIMQYSMQ